MGIWEQVLAFQKQGDDGPKKYLEKWLELEAKTRNNFTHVPGGSLYGEGRTARHNSAVDLDHGQG